MIQSERIEIMRPDPQLLGEFGLPDNLTEVLGAIRVCNGEEIVKKVLYTRAMPLDQMRRFGGVPHFNDEGVLEAAFYKVKR